MQKLNVNMQLAIKDYQRLCELMISIKNCVKYTVAMEISLAI